MASEQQLLDALTKADQAGDADSARIFADEIKKMRAGKQSYQGQMDMGPEYKAMMATDVDPSRQIEKARTIRQGNEAPEYLKPVIAASDIASNVSDAATFGWADKLSAYLSSLNGEKYDDALARNRKTTQEAEDRSGWAGTAAKVAGALGTGSLAADAGLTLSGRMAGASAPWLWRAASSALAGGVEGAGYGALDAKGHDQDVGKGAMDSALFGTALGPLAETAASVKGAILSRLRGTNAAPTFEQLRAAKDAAYKQSEDMGARYSPQTIDDLMSRIKHNVIDDPAGAREVIHPKTVDKVNQMDEMGITSPAPGVSLRTNPVSLYDLDAHRKSVRRDLLNSGDGGEQHFGGKIMDEIDATMADTDPSKVTSITGSPQDAMDSLLRARDLNSRMNKTDDLQSILAQSNRAVDASATGASAGQQIRQRTASLLNSDKRSLGFTPTEIQSLEELVRGSKFANAMRSTAAFTRSLPGRAAASSVGAMVGGMAMPGATGMTLGGGAGVVAGEAVKRAAEHLAEGSTRNALTGIIDDVARGRPKVPSRAEPGTMTPKEVSDAVRMLMLMRLQDPDAQSN